MSATSTLAGTPAIIPESSSGLSLPHNLAWTLAGNVVYMASQWAMLVVLAKLGSPEMVGQLALGLAVTAPIFLFANLRLRAVQATDARGEYLFGDYLTLRLLTTVLAIVVVGSLSLLEGYRPQTALVILMVAVAKAFESCSDIFYGLLQQRERMDRIAISMMIRGVLSVLVLGIAVSISGSVVAGTIALAFVWGLTLITYDIPSSAVAIHGAGAKFSRLLPRWDAPTIRRLAWVTMPLGLAATLSSLYVNVPRYFIVRDLGERQLGIFAALFYLTMGGSTLIAALAESASPRLARYYSSGRWMAFRNLLGKLVLLGVLLGAAGLFLALVAGREIVKLVYRPEYAADWRLLVWLMAASAMAYVASFFNYGMIAARYFRSHMALLALVTGTTALGCYWLIPHRGLQGAAIAMIAGMLLQTLGGFAGIAHAIYKADSR